jgi:hypothetical protein
MEAKTTPEKSEFEQKHGALLDEIRQFMDKNSLNSVILPSSIWTIWEDLNMSRSIDEEKSRVAGLPLQNQPSFENRSVDQGWFESGFMKLMELKLLAFEGLLKHDYGFVSSNEKPDIVIEQSKVKREISAKEFTDFLLPYLNDLLILEAEPEHDNETQAPLDSEQELNTPENSTLPKNDSLEDILTGREELLAQIKNDSNVSISSELKAKTDHLQYLIYLACCNDVIFNYFKDVLKNGRIQLCHYTPTLFMKKVISLYLKEKGLQASGITNYLELNPAILSPYPESLDEFFDCKIWNKYWRTSTHNTIKGQKGQEFMEGFEAWFYHPNFAHFIKKPSDFPV